MYESDDTSLKSNPLNSQLKRPNEDIFLSPLMNNDQNNDEKEIFKEDQIDDINFIRILMYVDGEDNGMNIANDEQFKEIYQLMDEYYGISGDKVLNKYEVWKKYIKNLKMKKNFNERSSQGKLVSDIETEK